MMKKVTFDLDDETLARVTSVADARQTSVETLLRQQTEAFARLVPMSIDNPSHRRLLSMFEGSQAGLSHREELYDREKARAEVYVANRKILLELIDKTDGDMGHHGWNRAGSYDR
jgi:hypothetical protein